MAAATPAGVAPITTTSGAVPDELDLFCIEAECKMPKQATVMSDVIHLMSDLDLRFPSPILVIHQGSRFNE
jgi:hypothetical protein